jgi:translocation and assembly module TamB
MRSLLRWLRRLVGGVLLLAVILTVIALVAVHTGWGREQLRKRAEAALAEAFPGGAHVGTVEGSIFGTLTLRDVELDDRERAPLVKIGTLHLAVSLWSLVVQPVHVDALIAEDVHAFAHRAPPSPASPPAAGFGPLPWPIELPHVEVHHGTLEIEAPGATQTLTDLDAAGNATAGAAGITVFGWAHGRWRERAAELTATLEVVLDAGVHVPAALVMLVGETQGATGAARSSDRTATASVTDLAIDGEHPSGTIAVRASARAVAALLPELAHAGVAPERLGDVAATIEITAPAPAKTRVVVNATAGPATVLAELDGDLAAQTAEGAITVHAADLGIVTREQVGGRGELFARGKGRREGGVISVELSRIVASSQAIDVFDQRVTGDLVINASGQGTLAPALDVTIAGSTTSKQIAVQALAIAGVTGPFQLHVGAGVPLGEAHLNATGIRHGDTPVGMVHADIANRVDGTFGVAATARPPVTGVEIFADAVVAPGTQAVARLGHTRVTLPNGMIWAGRGGSIAMNDVDVTMRDVRLTHGDATVALRGNFTRPTGALTAHVDADRFLASAIDDRYRGLGRGALDLARRGGSWSADGTFHVTGAALAPEAAPIDGTAHVALAGRRATLDASATNPELGRVELALEAVAPRDPFDLRAWRALDRGAVRNATITARQVALSGLAAVAGSPAWPRLTGTVDGAVNLAPAEPRGGFTVRGIELPDAAAGAAPSATIDGDLTFAPHDGDLAANATARLPGVADADVTARFAMPERPFDPATWQHRGRDFLKEAAVDLDEVAFDPELLARLGVAKLLAAHGLAAPYRGHATIELALGAAATEARLAINVHDVTGGALAEPVSSHLAISAGAQGTHLRAELVARDAGRDVDHDLGLGVLDASLPMTLDRWITEPATALRAPIIASWALPVTSAARMLALVGRHDLDGGTLEGSATIRGTLATPIITSARLLGHDLAVPQRLDGHPLAVLADLGVTATWGGASGTVEVTGHEVTGGELHAMLSGRPDALAEVTGWFTATRFDLAPLALVLSRPLVPTAGMVDAKLQLRAGGHVAGTLQVTAGVVPIAAAVGTLRDARADLVIDDRAVAGTIDGKLGRGTVHLVAGVDAEGKTSVKALQLREVSLQSAFRPVVTADVTATLGLEGGQLRGQALVKDAHIKAHGSAGRPLLDVTAPPDLVFKVAPKAVVATEPRAPLHPWLDVHVALESVDLDAPNVVDSIGLSVKGHLTDQQLGVLVGDTLGVNGTVAIDDADVDILGRRYQVEPSHLQFNGTIDPALAIRLTHQFPELTLNVDVRGRASDPKLQFTSEPATYSPDQLFGFFVGGEPGGDPTGQTGEAVKGAVALALSGKLGREINKVLPIKVDTLSCEPATTVTSASCTVGKWLSQRLFLAYRPHLEPLPDENANEVQVEYRLGSKVLIEGTGGDRQHIGADLLWRHRW